MKLKVVFILLFSLVLSIPVCGQKSNKKIKITGYVTDATYRPVTDAILMIDGDRISSTTDHKGYYKVKVSPSARKIGVFTFTTGVIEAAIDGRTRINFTLGALVSSPADNQNAAADEEEVNIGYGTVKRKNLTTQVGKINGTNKKYASYNSIYDMIRGEVAGVVVAGKSIRIHNATSFILSTEPLFVVDGMPVSSIDDIQPQMVRSIEVLKGSSASIYGSRGANGVILINLIRAADIK